MARALSLRSLIGQRPAKDAPKQEGVARPNRPGGPLIWFHIGAGGNLRAITTLASRFASESDQATFLITGALLDSGAIPENRHVIFQPDPPNTQTGARAFMDHWHPDMLFWMQDTLLPVLLAECVARKCPMVQLNAKQTTALNWAGRWKRVASRAILEEFTAVMAVDTGAAARLRRAGYNPDRIEVTGALEEESIALPFNEAERNEMAALIGARPVWFASDLAASEIEAIAEAYQLASKRGYRLLLVITPRDVNDSADMAQKLRDLGLQVGPATGRHGTAYERLTAAAACRAANTPERLAEAVGLMNTPDRMAQMAQAGWAVVTDGAEVTNRVLAMIRAHLDAKGG